MTISDEQIDPLAAHEEIAKFPELFDVHKAVSRVATEVDILERHMRQPGMYPLFQSPIPITSGIAPHRSDSSFKPIHPAAPSTASRPATQGSSNTLLNMVDNSQGKGSSPGSFIPCAQKSPEQQTSTGTSAHSNNLHNTLQQNVAQGQPPAAN